MGKLNFILNLHCLRSNLKAACRFQTKYTVPIFHMKRCTYTCIFLTIGIYTLQFYYMYIVIHVYMYMYDVYIYQKEEHYTQFISIRQLFFLMIEHSIKYNIHLSIENKR